jgi:hypothetical protein
MLLLVICHHLTQENSIYFLMEGMPSSHLRSKKWCDWVLMAYNELYLTYGDGSWNVNKKGSKSNTSITPLLWIGVCTAIPILNFAWKH